MQVRLAKCHCEQSVIRCSGNPRKISMCHCRDCQRRTGSAFSIAVFFARESVAIERGQLVSYTRDSATGFPVTFRFCPVCGTSFLWEPRRLPELIGVAGGAFADPDLQQPEQSVWTRDKHRWLVLPPEMTIYQTLARMPPSD